ncbi:hypothetical protein KKF32_01680 [Patescibacteria group bacterium]|nr:hypothetical protein [Patescibacteria group bacterium]
MNGDQKNINTDGQIKDLLEKNLVCVEEILKVTKKIKKHLLWTKVTRLIYILLIVVPLILSIIYLPSFLDKTIDKLSPESVVPNQYLQDLLDNSLYNR